MMHSSFYCAPHIKNPKNKKGRSLPICGLLNSVLSLPTNYIEFSGFRRQAVLTTGIGSQIMARRIALWEKFMGPVWSVRFKESTIFYICP